mmetsp:Transcript_42610/g.76547  ORF Transcript_42610/g.76547 Transcript_42610/m.76547 type:complete len:247 (+) Transcript_42610:1807-2547(+)
MNEPHVDLLVQCHGREDDTVSPDTILLQRSLPEDLFSRGRELQEPQDGVGGSLQDTHPHTEDTIIDLVQLVETCEYKLVSWESQGPAGGQLGSGELGGIALLVVVNEVGVRHVCNLLRVQVVELGRGRDGIRNEVVNEGAAHCASKPHVLYLHRGSTQGQDLTACALGVPVQIHQNVELMLLDHFAHVKRLRGAHIKEPLDTCLDQSPCLCTIIGCQCIGEDFETSPVMHGKVILHQLRKGMVPKV